jgi:hypothetical protein
MSGKSGNDHFKNLINDFPSQIWFPYFFMYFNHENRDLRISSLSPAQDFSHVAGPMLQLCLPKELAAKKR